MSSPRISLIYATARDDPAFEWFADGLARQLADDADVEVIVVDGRFETARTSRFDGAVAGRFAFRHVPAKPSPYQGPHRRTSRDCFAAASARNTGIVYARAPCVAFVDDCTVPMPGWWAAVSRAAASGDVVTGAYQKRWNMHVRDGVLVDCRGNATGVDTRWDLGDDARPVAIRGGQLYTTSFVAPRDLLVGVNGFDELCDSAGSEDCQLGIRLEASGVPILYDRSMLTYESIEHGLRGPVLARIGRDLAPEAYVARLAEFGVRRRHTSGRCDTPHMILDIAFGIGSAATHGNYYHLADLTPDGFARTIRRFPDAHWFDGCPLSAL